MKKIKIAFAALSAIAGIGGAYSAAHADSNARALTYNWYTPAGAPFLASATTVAAASAGSCTGGPSVCLRGTNVLKGQAQVTLFKPQRP